MSHIVSELGERSSMFMETVIMINNSFKVAFTLLFGMAATTLAQRQMENLTRGVVAVKQPGGIVYVSWRCFGTDPETVAFNLYRATDGSAPVKVNEKPIADSTNYLDRSADTSQPLQYFVRPVLNGKELAPSEPAHTWDKNYLEIPIQSISRYRPGDASIADLDGDGEYEIVLHQISGARDNAHTGITGTPVFDAYEMDGTHLWRINLGINIREGEHYTQFMVYDLDGDGRAEMACKTADGTTDGKGRIIGDKDKDWRTRKEGDRTHGRILKGPEYFTIFDGRTGAALKTVDYIPSRDPINGWGGIGGNGGNDSYGNRCDRFLACVAYLDGKRPSVVMCRGVYGRIVMVAWDWRDGELTRRWVFDSGISYPPFEDASPYSGMGGHSLSVADVDGDSKDEIVYHAMVVDDNGQGLYSSGLRHGDSMHLSNMYPDRPGLEVFTIHENEAYTVRFKTPGAAMRDARTGELLWEIGPGIDVGRGLAADIDPRHRGYEAWGGPGGLRDSGGKEIGPNPRSNSFAIWWDGDLLRELVSRSTINKWDWKKGVEKKLFATGSRGGARGPNLMGDFIGDWREELLMTAPDGKALRLYTSTIPTDHRLYTLMHDPQYRLAIAWQNVVYNKPPHPGFFLGNGMAPPPRPSIYLIGKGEAIAGVGASN
jgi:rhamnogalacturonan endolyase